MINTSVTVALKYGGFSIKEGTASKNSGGSVLPKVFIYSSRFLSKVLFKLLKN